jgi:leucyl aminopeptidase
MPIAIQLSPSVPADAEVLGVGVYADRLEDGEVPGPLDASYLTTQGFTAKPGETLVAPGPGGQVVVALGLGDQGEVTTKVFRKAAAALARAAHRQQRVATTLLADVPGSDPEGFGEGDGGGLDRAEVARALAEGTILGAYRYTALKSDPEASNIVRVDVVAADEGADGSDGVVTAAFDRGVAIAQAVCLARDLVNEPGGELTPTAFADKAVELARSGRFTAEVLDRQAIEGEKMGGLLGVNRGSEEEPRFVKLAYEPESPRATIALVGKGITFDSGGLSLKTADGMIGMKCDMAGAAAVLATFSALGAMRPPVRVLGFLPLTDNMPGGDAARVGDVLRIRNGTTVEVLNTDAEGRLVLADGLAMAGEAQPDAIIDLATLTGACMVALGTRIAGLMGNDERFIAQVQAAADAAGEDVWPLPLPGDMRKSLDSDVADIKNVAGGRWGGALVAGVFLQEFVSSGTPWAHLDIAGPADAQDEDPETRKGGTGFGVRTLLRLLSDYEPAPAPTPA